MTDDKRRPAIAVVERVIAADPARVWALVADPEHIAEWTGLEMVGYMGTELPKPGQSVFVRSRRTKSVAKTRRVEIQDWNAGNSVRCLVESNRSAEGIRFEIGIWPEVIRDGISTRVRLTQGMDVANSAYPLAGWVLRRMLDSKLNRIEKAVAK